MRAGLGAGGTGVWQPRMERPDWGTWPGGVTGSCRRTRSIRPGSTERCDRKTLYHMKHFDWEFVRAKLRRAQSYPTCSPDRVDSLRQRRSTLAAAAASSWPDGDGRIRTRAAETRTRDDRGGGAHRRRRDRAHGAGRGPASRSPILSEYDAPPAAAGVLLLDVCTICDDAVERRLIAMGRAAGFGREGRAGRERGGDRAGAGPVFTGPRSAERLAAMARGDGGSGYISTRRRCGPLVESHGLRVSVQP